MIPEVVARWRPHAIAYRGQLDYNLILAVIWQESAGDQWAYRYEPGYQYFYDVNAKKSLYDRTLSVADNRAKALKALGATEFAQQSASWGLMQSMGAVARERGFSGYMPKLCDAQASIKLCCGFLNDLYDRNGKDVRKSLLRYNGGSSYPDEVFAKLKEIQ